MVSYFYAARHGSWIYSHPLWCFRKDQGGDWGFKAGNRADDDLPQRMEVPLAKMKSHLFNLLQKKDMFPKDSNLVRVVQSCYGDGYKAIKAILFKAHPVFYDQPAIMITGYPKQRETTILEYYHLFLDYIQLRAFIANSTSTLDDTHDLDIFINNAKHSDYLNRVTRDERRQAVMEHKYKGQQLVETLTKFLMASDSPARTKEVSSRITSPITTSRTASPSTVPYKSSSPNRRAARVHQLSLSAYQDEELPSSGSDDSPNVVDVSSISVPDEPEARELYHVYNACMFRYYFLEALVESEKDSCGSERSEERYLLEFLKRTLVRSDILSAISYENEARGVQGKADFTVFVNGKLAVMGETRVPTIYCYLAISVSWCRSTRRLTKKSL